MRDVHLLPPTAVLPQAKRQDPEHPADIDRETGTKFLNGPFAPWHEKTEAFGLP